MESNRCVEVCRSRSGTGVRHSGGGVDEGEFAFETDGRQGRAVGGDVTYATGPECTGSSGPTILPVANVDDPQAAIEPADRVRRAVEAEVARPGSERNAYPADDTAVVDICEHDL